MREIDRPKWSATLGSTPLHVRNQLWPQREADE
jgi:hypothetical protein